MIKYSKWDGKEARRKWVRHEMQRLPFKLMIIRYNQLRLRNNSNKMSTEQNEELASLYRPTQPNRDIAVSATTSLLKMEEVRAYADKALEEALTEHGITKSYLVGKRKELLNMAVEKGDLKMADVTLNKLDDFVGIKQTVTTTETKSIDYGALNDIPSHVEIQQIEEVKGVDNQDGGGE